MVAGGPDSLLPIPQSSTDEPKWPQREEDLPNAEQMETLQGSQEALRSLVQNRSLAKTKGFCTAHLEVLGG